MILNFYPSSGLPQQNLSIDPPSCVGRMVEGKNFGTPYLAPSPIAIRLVGMVSPKLLGVSDINHSMVYTIQHNGVCQYSEWHGFTTVATYTYTMIYYHDIININPDMLYMFYTKYDMIDIITMSVSIFWQEVLNMEYDMIRTMDMSQPN